MEIYIQSDAMENMDGCDAKYTLYSDAMEKFWTKVKVGKTYINNNIGIRAYLSTLEPPYV